MFFTRKNAVFMRLLAFRKRLIDYNIEGSSGIPISVECFDEYQQGGHGHTVSHFIKKKPIKGWKKGEDRHFFHLTELKPKMTE